MVRGTSLVDRVHLAGANVDADDSEAALGEGYGQRKAHVAQADDGGGGVACVEFVSRVVCA